MAVIARATPLAAAVLAAVGCASTGRSPGDLPPAPPAMAIEAPAADTAARAAAPDDAGQESARPKAATTALPTPQPLPAPTTLNTAEVVRVVLDRNPTVEQMRATAEAAAARFPQVTSLDDPIFSFNTAPFSAGSPNADYAARVEVSQKLLYPGKRGLKGTAAAAEAHAAELDVEDVRLQLVEAAMTALADLYAADKSRAVAEENRKLLGEFRKSALSRYENGQAPQQDVLQAEVEIARVEEQLVASRRAGRVATARLNTLMHLPPDAPLPPPPDPVPASPPDPAALRARASAARPDLKALADRVAAEDAALALAVREYNPDADVFAAYDGFWQGVNSRPLQWQVGVRVNLPTRYARRAGAVAEARAKAARRRAELARQTDQVNLQVQEAVEQVREADDVAAVYKDKAIPAAEANVKEARSGYAAGTVSFLALVEAQRTLTGLREKYYQAVAEGGRRRAALTRAVGEPVDRPAPTP